MNVKPMIFNTEMVEALLDGRKTVTRRPMSPQPEPSEFGYDWWPSKIVGGMVKVNGFEDGDYYLIEVIPYVCPIACKRDLIYVRETFRLFDNSDECGCSEFCGCPPTGTPVYFATHNDGDSKWKPSIHMPRWASRLTLKVTDVRIERVQEITEAQAEREGVSPSFENEFGKCPVPPSYRAGFFKIWDSIYENWRDNPYVWVIEFEVIHQNVDKYLEASHEN